MHASQKRGSRHLRFLDLMLSKPSLLCQTPSSWWNRSTHAIETAAMSVYLPTNSYTSNIHINTCTHATKQAQGTFLPATSPASSDASPPGLGPYAKPCLSRWPFTNAWACWSIRSLMSATLTAASAVARPSGGHVEGHIRWEHIMVWCMVEFVRNSSSNQEVWFPQPNIYL